jgi:hypothetical protein
MKRPDRLDSLRIVSPCTVPWDDMKGDDAVRYCGKCSKNVYNVAALTRAEAIELVERAEGRICMQLSWRRDGTVATGDCWARLRRARRRGLLALLVALPVIFLAQLWSQAFGLRFLTGLFDGGPAIRRTMGAPLPPPTLGAPVPLRGEIAPPEKVLLGKMAPPRR